MALHCSEQEAWQLVAIKILAFHSLIVCNLLLKRSKLLNLYCWIKDNKTCRRVKRAPWNGTETHFQFTLGTWMFSVKRNRTIWFHTCSYLNLIHCFKNFKNMFEFYMLVILRAFYVSVYTTFIYRKVLHLDVVAWDCSIF